ncbi:hypothetical protein D3C86_1156290 [compost metagenome]
MDDLLRHVFYPKHWLCFHLHIQLNLKHPEHTHPFPALESQIAVRRLHQKNFDKVHRQLKPELPLLPYLRKTENIQNIPIPSIDDNPKCFALEFSPLKGQWYFSNDKYYAVRRHAQHIHQGNEQILDAYQQLLRQDLNAVRFCDF